MLTCLVPVLFTFYIQDVIKLKKNNSGTKRLTECDREAWARRRPWPTGGYRSMTKRKSCCGVLGHEAIYSGRSAQTFQGIMLPPNSGLNSARQRQWISQNRWHRRQAVRCHIATVGRQVCVGFGPLFRHIIGLYLCPRLVLLIIFVRLLDRTGLSFVLWLPLTVLRHVQCPLSVQAFYSASCVSWVTSCYA